MMKTSKFGKIGTIICLLLTFVLVFSLASCKDGGNDDDAALTLSKTSVTVAEGETTTVSVTSSTTETIEWSVDKPEIATVAGSGAGNKLGTVSGVAEGTAVVTAKAGDLTATCAVTVSKKSEGGQPTDPDANTVTIKLGDDAVSGVQYLHVDDSVTYTATASKGGTISWESSNEDVATVENGVVTAKTAGQTVITAKVSDTVKATVTVDVAGPTNIVFDAGRPNGWSYWNGDGDVNLSKMCRYENDGQVVVKYTATYGAAHALQVRLNDKNTGTSHNVSLTVVSPVAGKIVVNGQEVELVVGENNVTVENYSDLTLHVQFGSGDGWNGTFITGTDLEFVLKNIVITSNAEELSVPSFTYDETENTVAITDEDNDPENVGGYQLGFFASATATEPVQTVTVVNGEEVDFTTVSGGDYIVRIRALGANVNYISSDWSEGYEEISVTNSNTPITTTSTDGWYYWTEGSVGKTFVDADGAVHIEDLNASANTYSFQLKINVDTPVTSIKMTVHAESAGYLAFGPESGSVQEREIAADTDVEIEITGVSIAGTLVICFGNNISSWSGSEKVCLSGTVILSNIVIA